MVNFTRINYFCRKHYKLKIMLQSSEMVFVMPNIANCLMYEINSCYLDYIKVI